MSDLIDRQAAIDAIEAYARKYNTYPIAVYDAVGVLRRVQPAQPQRTGKWIKITKGAMREKYICSVCGRTIEEDGIERLVPIKYPFCHCGAKMEGAADND